MIRIQIKVRDHLSGRYKYGAFLENNNTPVYLFRDIEHFISIYARANNLGIVEEMTSKVLNGSNPTLSFDCEELKGHYIIKKL